MTDDPIARLRAADPLGGELPAPLERMPSSEAATRARGRRWREGALMAANLALLATVLLHGLDHAFVQERGMRGVSFEVLLGGMSITAASALSLAATLRHDRRAPLVALIVGPWVAAAIVVGHFVPDWGEFSDSYEKAGVETVSYVMAAAAAVAGLVVAAAGAAAALAGSTPRARGS
jgi:hypothetical protein